MDSSKFEADPCLPAPFPWGEEINHYLAYAEGLLQIAVLNNVVYHTPGEGEARNNSECSSIFVEPLQWMTAVEEGALEGKLSCARSKGWLGNFNWLGIQCGCGSWISPALQLHKSGVEFGVE